MRFLAFMLLSLPSLAAAQEREHYRVPDYDPKLNRVPVQNTGATAFAPGGACAGMAQFERLYWHARQANSSLPPLAEVMGQVRQRGGEGYVQDLAGLFQRIAEAQQGPQHPFLRVLVQEGATRPPFVGEPSRTAIDRVRTEFQRAPRDLVPLEFYRPSTIEHPKPFYHRVNVWGYYATERGMALRISNPNTPPNDPNAESLILYHDRDASTWQIRDHKGMVMTGITDVGVVQDPAQNALMWRVLEMARRGQSIRNIQDSVGIARDLTWRERFERDAKKTAKTFADWMKAKAGKVLDVTVDKVNGVMIRHDPLLFEGAITEKDLGELVAQIKQFLKNTDEGALQISLLERREHLHLVSVRQLVDSGATTLGKLTRVRGYVQNAAGELFLAGLVEEGKEPIPLDLLTVALRTVWQKGLTPFISLDPNPADFTAPHKVRIGGIPEELRHTEFVRALVEADYAMKCIALGKIDPKIDGFRNVPQLMSASPEGPKSVMIRFWLAPRPIPVAGLMETRQEAASAVLFESAVEVLTESMKQAGELLIGTGEADPIAEEEARLLTRFLPELEAFDANFHKLHVVFDLTKLCAIWRHRNIQSVALDALAKRQLAKVRVKDGYEAFSLQAGAIVTQGGAKTRHRVSKKAVVTTEKLAPLLEAAGGAWKGLQRDAGEVTLPRTFVFKGAAAAPFNVELQLTRVGQALSDGLFENALKRLNHILQLDPDEPEATAMRAAVLAFLHRHKEALADIERVQREMPQLQGLRGCVRACLGDRAGAARDADEAARAFPEEPVVAAWNLATHMELFDLDAADADLNRLSKLLPSHPLVSISRSQVKTFRRLGPDKAKEHLQRIRAIPGPISLALLRGGTLLFAKPNEAIPLLERAHDLARASSAPALKELAVVERCQFLLGLGYALKATSDRDGPTQKDGPGLAFCNQLVKDHPDWPSGYVGQAMAKMAARAPMSEVVAAFDEAVKRAAAKDPVLAELAVDLGSDRVVAWFGNALWLGLMENGGNGREILDRLITLLGASPDAEFLRVLRDQKNLDFAEALRVFRQRGFGGGMQVKDKEAVLKALRAAESRLPDKAATDSVALSILLTFYKVHLLLELDPRDSARLVPMYLKFLRLSRLPDPPDAITGELVNLRSAMTKLLIAGMHTEIEKNMNEVFQDKFKHISADLDKALKAKDEGAIKQRLRDMTDLFGGMLTTVRKATRDRIDRLRREAGPLEAAVLELHLGYLQQQFGSDPSFGRLGEVLPEAVKNSEEMKKFQEVLKDMPARLWVTREVKAVWSEVLDNLTNRVDAMVLRDFLKDEEKFARLTSKQKGTAALDKMQEDLQGRIQSGNFGKPAASPAKKAPAPTPQPEPPAKPKDKEVSAVSSDPPPGQDWVWPAAIAGSAGCLLLAVIFLVRSRSGA